MNEWSTPCETFTEKDIQTWMNKTQVLFSQRYERTIHERGNIVLLKAPNEITLMTLSKTHDFIQLWESRRNTLKYYFHYQVNLVNQIIPANTVIASIRVRASNAEGQQHVEKEVVVVEKEKEYHIQVPFRCLLIEINESFFQKLINNNNSDESPEKDYLAVCLPKEKNKRMMIEIG